MGLGLTVARLGSVINDWARPSFRPSTDFPSTRFQISALPSGKCDCEMFQHSHFSTGGNPQCPPVLELDLLTSCCTQACAVPGPQTAHPPPVHCLAIAIVHVFVLLKTESFVAAPLPGDAGHLQNRDAGLATTRTSLGTHVSFHLACVCHGVP
jgi:hypothetical protein